MEGPEVDVAIIGAGLSGIAFARFYLDVHPYCNLTILEKDMCIGGVWSTARVFDAFWVQSPLRMTSFSDVPLTIPEHAPTLHDTFQAEYVTQYLEEYINSHVYNGQTLRDRVRLGAEVRSVEKSETGWILQINGADSLSIRCARVAVASGLTSSPIFPRLSYHPDWTAPVLHHRDFGVHAKSILKVSPFWKNVTVVGGGKSAADMVYASIKAGKNVNWIVRKTGEGPGIFMNPAATGRYRNNVEMGATRKATTLSPSYFHSIPEWAQELHHSVSQRAELESKLYAADRRYKAWANYRGRKDALPGFRELEPTASFFWSNGPVGMIQHDDFWDLVSRKVNIYRADFAGTTNKSIILNDGREVLTDVLLCGTGWSSTYPFFSPKQLCRLGLPHDPCDEDSKEAQTWNDLMEMADKQILEEYPILANPPIGCRPIGGNNLTAARLYNGMAPLTDKSVIFLGRARMSNNFLGAEAQAIWATAYWDGHIILPEPEQARREVAHMNAFSRRRYPSRGVDGLNFHADLLWYTDKLVTEAGLNSHRKGWWDDDEEPCLASDFKDCKNEYLTRYGPNEAA